MIRRRSDWQVRFRNAVDTASKIQFRFGVHDCCLFVAYVLDQMCDSDFVANVRERYGYSDELQALNIIEAGGGLKAIVSEWLGDPVAVGNVCAGDVVLLRIEGRVSLGVVESHCAIAAALHGVDTVPLMFAECGWKV